MAQVWYIGPIAKQVGEYGGDVCEKKTPQRRTMLTMSRWATMSVSLGQLYSTLLSDGWS